MKAPLPANEKERLAALRSYEVLDTPPEEAFDDLAKLAAQICGTPTALVSLVDEARQWFKARVGMEEAETSRDVAFCAHGILQNDVMVVPDAAKDARFSENPLVTRPSGIRFYAGAPLVTSDGHALGMVCVTDQQPRGLTQSQSEALRLLARQIVVELELRKRSRELEGEIQERKRTEKRLRTSEERFRRAFDDAPIGMSLVNPDGRWLKVNHALSAMLGYDEGELLVTDFQHITHPDDLQPDLELMQQVLDGAIPSYRMEKRYIHKNGSTVYALLSVSLVRDSDGTPVYFVSQVENITERKVAEQALHASEERFRLIVDGVKDYALLMLDADGFVESWSAGAQNVQGFLADEIVGLHISSFYPPEAIAAGRPQEALRTAARDGRYEENGWRVRSDGSRFWANVVITAIREEDGKLRGFAKVTHDITEKWRAEERLKLETQRLSLAARAGQIGVWDWDLETNQISWDETVYKIYGLPVGAPVTYDIWKKALLTADLEEAETALRRVVNEKSRGEMEFRVERPNKMIRHVEAAMDVTLDKDGKATRVVGVNLDITERKLHETEREKIIADLQQLLMQVKTLSGLIPICGWCKKVRSDTGYWQSVEQYVRASTGATFSHGICPTCAANFKDEIGRANSGEGEA